MGLLLMFAYGNVQTSVSVTSPMSQMENIDDVTEHRNLDELACP